MAKEKFNRDLANANISTMGHVDHGKTTLMAALVNYSAREGRALVKGYDDIDNAPEERNRGITINASTVEFSTKTRHYAATDCPGHKDYIKNFIVGTSKVDFAIAVVATTDGAMPQTLEHFILAKQTGLTPDRLVVFLNKVDAIAEEDREEFVMLAEEEIRDRIKHIFKDEKKYPNAADQVVFVSGSALLALNQLNALKENPSGPSDALEPIAQLLEVLDSKSLPDRDVDKAFYMSVESVASIPGRGTAALGRVSRGTLKLGEKIEIISSRHGIKETTATGLEMFHKELDFVQAGDNPGVLLRGVDRKEIERGDVLAKPGSIKPTNRFRAKLLIMTKEEGGRHKPFTHKYRPQFYVETNDVTGHFVSIKDGSGQEMKVVMPGDNITVEVELERPIALRSDLAFSVREGGRTVGEGSITEILPQGTSEKKKKKSGKE